MPESAVAISPSYPPRGRLGRRISVQADVLEVEGRVVDADFGRGDPARDLARLGDTPHQARDEAAVLAGRQPVALPKAPFLLGDRAPLRVGPHAGPDADRAVEADARQPEPKIIPGFCEKPVPALHPDIAIPDIGGAR